MLEEPGGETSYGYGWVPAGHALGPVAWHNGGNGLSYAEIARVLGSGVMVFWVTNQVRDRARGWDLQRLGSRITGGTLLRLLRP